MEIKSCSPVIAQSTPEGTVVPLTEQCDNLDGEIIMLVSGIIGTASLVAVLVLLLVGGLALAVVDKKVDAHRQH